MLSQTPDGFQHAQNIPFHTPLSYSNFRTPIFVIPFSYSNFPTPIFLLQFGGRQPALAELLAVRSLLKRVFFFSWLQIQLQTLDIRLSYNDVQLFLAIAKSISKQTSGGLPSPPAAVDPSAPSGSSGVNEVSGTAAERTETAKRLLDPVLGTNTIFKLGVDFPASAPHTTYCYLLHVGASTPPH